MNITLANPDRFGLPAAIRCDGDHTRGAVSVLPWLARLSLPIGFSPAACGLLGWYLVNHQDQWHPVTSASPWLFSSRPRLSRWPVWQL